MLVLALLVAAACALPGAPPVASSAAGPADDHITLRLKPNTSWIVQLSPDGLVGPTVNLGFYGTGIRGNSDSRAVDLQTTPTSVAGQAPGWTQLQVSATPDALSASGEFGGRPAKLELSPTGIKALFDQCEFDLQGAAGKYRGTSSCQSPWPIELELPRGMAGLSPAMQAAVIGLVLDHGS